MASKRAEKLKELFDAALERKTSERAAFLDGLSALDPSLRQEVESLIASHEQADSSLEKPPLVESVTVTRQRESEADSPDARQIGPYRILQEVGAAECLHAGVTVSVSMFRGRRVGSSISCLPPNRVPFSYRPISARVASSVGDPMILGSF
jgi:hypothetical protein